MNDEWLGLVIGNSRLHWALFEGENWQASWHTPHLTAVQVEYLQQQQWRPQSWRSLTTDTIPAALETANQPIPLWIGSVVKSQQALWQGYAAVYNVQREHLPLDNLYDSLGLDRALVLIGAAAIADWPVLVIDGGTALTLTAGVDGCFWGGAILPGLGLQVYALAHQTDALPAVDIHNSLLPPRWAHSTVGAIQSGILLTIVAGLESYVLDWWQQYPTGSVLFTGGDGAELLTLLKQQSPTFERRLDYQPNLMFWGLQAYRAKQLTNR